MKKYRQTDRQTEPNHVPASPSLSLSEEERRKGEWVY